MQGQAIGSFLLSEVPVTKEFLTRACLLSGDKQKLKRKPLGQNSLILLYLTALSLSGPGTIWLSHTFAECPWLLALILAVLRIHRVFEPYMRPP